VAIATRARLTSLSEAARWGGVSTDRARAWRDDPMLADDVTAALVAVRGAWVEELSEACATTARALAELVLHHADLAREVLEEGAELGPSGEPLTARERLRASSEVLSDLRQVLSSATEVLTHHAAVVGTPKPGSRAVRAA
jgi:hypothetical protein